MHAGMLFSSLVAIFKQFAKGNLILKMEVKSKEGMGKQIMHKDFMFVFLQNLESRVAASREAHKEKSCQLAS